MTAIRLTTHQREALEFLERHADGYRGALDHRVVGPLVLAGFVSKTFAIGGGRPLYRLTIKGRGALAVATPATTGGDAA